MSEKSRKTNGLRAFRSSCKSVRLYQRLLVVMIACSMVAAGTFFYLYLLEKVPNTIFLRVGEETELDFNVPVSGEIHLESVEAGNYEEFTSDVKSLDVNFGHKTVFCGNQSECYSAQLKLFGILPYKTVQIETITDQKLIPVGIPIGIYVKMDGVMVIDTGSFINSRGEEVSPVGGILERGDYIVAINQTNLLRKSELVTFIAENGEKPFTLTIKRPNKKGDDYSTFDVTIESQFGEDGEYKIGVWIRDSIQGIGTMTYIDEEGNYGALGHGISDMDTNQLVDMEYGNIYDTKIVAIQKGERGEPGEMTGLIQYSKEHILGSIESNSNFGVNGIINESQFTSTLSEPIPIALKQEVQIGDAQIVSWINGEPEYYSAKITGINMDYDNNKRAISIKITDERLLDLTGGIIQGMSGSPIIQNGKIVGAVTHVLVNDPQCGYGIFVENMMLMR